MTEIVAMIERCEVWRRRHHSAGRHLEALATAVREHALLDALAAIGGETTKWRKPSGVLR